MYNETKNNIIQKLKGKYGFKRFGRDGYKSVVVDPKRRYKKKLRLSKKFASSICLRFYEKSEIKNFEGVECEWPLFYIFMIIDGVFKSNSEQIAEYQNLLKSKIYIDQHGGMLY